MKHGFVVGHFLLPANQYAPESIHPRMSALAHPATRSIARAVELALSLLASSQDMGLVAACDDCLKNVSIVVAFVQTHVLKDNFMFLREHLLTIKRVLDQTLIVRVCGGDGQSNRDPVALGHQTALGASLGPVGWIWAGFFPRQAVP